MSDPAHPSTALAGPVLLGTRDPAELGPDEQRELFAWLTRGKTVLFTANPDDPDGSSIPRIPELATSTLCEPLEAEREHCDAQRGALLAAQRQLARADIPLILFKTPGPYPYTSSNVDALVPPGSLDRAARVLEAAGHLEMSHYWEPNKRLLRRFRGGRCELILHLHDKVSWIVLAFLDMDALWRQARTSSDPHVRHPSPEHLVCVLLAHSVYEANRVSPGDLDKVRSALDTPDFDWGEVLRVAREHSWLPGLALARYWYAGAERLLFGESRLDAPAFRAELPTVGRRALSRIDAALARGRWPLVLPKHITKPYFFRKLLIDSPRTPLQKLQDLWGVFLQIGPGRLGLRRHPASFVCLCGIDGSGKTTLARTLHEALHECELPSVRVWMRGGFAPLTELVKGALRTSSSRVPDVSDETAKSRVYRGGRLRWLWAWWVALEQILEGVYQVRIPRWLGRTAVAERYLPDTLADLAERFGDPEFALRLPARLMRALCPRPDCVFLLDLPGEVAFARKSDAWSPEALEQRRELYRSLLQEHPALETLDATRPLAELESEIVDRALRIVLGRIAARNPLTRLPRDRWE